ncbi:MFS transporter [Cryobacterium glucosi]|uniref:MFS transporter n=2 Tax=Cryobacterium glucosi TaxID=1259175 RepID=A0ABY2IS94_9MICO|nr:MFS transporter [Cryobacterium glucosi]
MHSRMTRHQLVALLILLSSQFLLSVDFSILNVALPEIGSALGFASADVQWVATTFALCAAGFTLLLGRLGDWVGRRRMFVIGMAVLAGASLVGGFAGSPAVLLVARALQGLATAAAMPAALALVTSIFPEGPLRRRALGLSSVLASLGFTAGAVFGGILTNYLSWRAAFLVNVPIAAAVVVLALLIIREPTREHQARLDVRGAALITTALITLVFAMSRFGEHGVTDPNGLICLAASIVLIVFFIRTERRHSAPLVPLKLLTRPNILAGHLIGFASLAMETGLVFLSTMYFQHVLELDPLITGLIIGLTGVGAVVGGVIGPRVVGRLGIRGAMLLGLGTQALATAALIAVNDHPGSIALYSVVGFIAAIGHMVAVVTFLVAATSGVEPGQQGLATGLVTMTQQVGMTLGTPIVSAIATAAGGLSSLLALRIGIGIDALIVAAFIAVVAIVLRRVSIRRAPGSPLDAQRDAHSEAEQATTLS